MYSSLFSDFWAEVQGYYGGLIALLPKLITAILLFLIFYFVANYVRKLVRTWLIHRMEDPLLAQFLARTIKIVIILIGVLVFLNTVGLGAAAGGLLASAGVGAFILGFAFKDIGENFLAGIMLAFNRPFKVGDVVELDGIQGKIVSLDLRNVHIKTADGRDVFIPNGSIVKNPVINLTIDGDLRFDFTVGLDYGSELGKAVEIILHTLKEVPGVMHEPRKPFVMVSDLAASTLNVGVYYWIDAFDPAISASIVKNQAVAAVLSALNEAGFYLPSEIMEIKNYNNSDLMAVTKAAKEADNKVDSANN